MNRRQISKTLLERFGDPIGTYAGQSTVGVRDEAEACSSCGMMPIKGGCSCQGSDVCPRCGMMPAQVDKPCTCGLSEGKMCEMCGMEEDVCECGIYEAKRKKKGPTKKTAQKILKGTKTFKEKMKKVEKWADDPGAAAAWMMHKATGKWPSEK